MNKLNFLSLLILVLMSFRVFSQNAIGIEYTLPKEVNEVLKNQLRKELTSSDGKKFYCVLASNSNRITLSMQSYNVKTQNEFIGTINLSNRFILIDTTVLPVIFDIDFLLIAYGKDSKGRPIRKHLIYEHPYKIEFDNTGKIFSKSF